MLDQTAVAAVAATRSSDIAAVDFHLNPFSVAVVVVAVHFACPAA
jgi:hypothetical protein